jgi:hypothetical protein
MCKELTWRVLDYESVEFMVELKRSMIPTSLAYLVNGRLFLVY